MLGSINNLNLSTAKLKHQYHFSSILGQNVKFNSGQYFQLHSTHTQPLQRSVPLTSHLGLEIHLTDIAGNVVAFLKAWNMFQSLGKIGNPKTMAHLSTLIRSHLVFDEDLLGGQTWKFQSPWSVAYTVSHSFLPNNFSYPLHWQDYLIPYMSKFSRGAIFADCYFQTFRGNNIMDQEFRLYGIQNA